MLAVFRKPPSPATRRRFRSYNITHLVFNDKCQLRIILSESGVFTGHNLCGVEHNTERGCQSSYFTALRSELYCQSA